MSTPRYRRSVQAAAYHRLYKLKAWRDLRAQQLAIEPTCRMCRAAGRTTLATVCDHVVPHRGDLELFWKGPFQSLCDQAPFRCHSSRKQRIEALGYEPGCDASGRPIDPGHPWNRK